MELRILVLSVGILQVFAERAHCDVYINDVCHEKELLTDIFAPLDEYEDADKDDRALGFVMDYTANTLYYIFCSHCNPRRTLFKQRLVQYDFIAKIVVMDNMYFHPSSIAIDQEDHVVYVKTEDGILVYNSIISEKRRLGHLDAYNYFIKEVFFTDKLYYALYGLVYTYSNNKSTVYATLERSVHKFVIDKDGGILFSDDYGITMKYRRKGAIQSVDLGSVLNYYSELLKDFETARVCLKDGIYNINIAMNLTKMVRISEFECSSEGFESIQFQDSVRHFSSLSTDFHGNAYVCADSGIYTITKTDATVELTKISEIRCEGLAFDRNHNVIVYDDHKIYRYNRLPHDRMINKTHPSVTKYVSDARPSVVTETTEYDSSEIAPGKTIESNESVIVKDEKNQAAALRYTVFTQYYVLGVSLIAMFIFN